MKIQFYQMDVRHLQNDLSQKNLNSGISVQLFLWRSDYKKKRKRSLANKYTSGAKVVQPLNLNSTYNVPN